MTIDNFLFQIKKAQHYITDFCFAYAYNYLNNFQPKTNEN